MRGTLKTNERLLHKNYASHGLEVNGKWIFRVSWERIGYEECPHNNDKSAPIKPNCGNTIENGIGLRVSLKNLPLVRVCILAAKLHLFDQSLQHVTTITEICGGANEDKVLPEIDHTE